MKFTVLVYLQQHKLVPSCTIK